MRTIFSVVIATVVLFADSGTRADITLCNHSAKTIWISYGTEKWLRGALCHVGNSTRDEIRGWWHLTPGQCVTVEVGCVCNFWANFFGN